MPVGNVEENNIGMRDRIKKKMVNHYSNLYKMKATID